VTDTPKLTPKQAAFVRAYLETGNASEAYRRAYNAENMKPEVIKVKASELLKNGNVAVTVSQRQAQVAEKHGVTVERIVAELAKIGFSDIRKVVKWGSRRVTADEMEQEVEAGEAVFTNSVQLIPSEQVDDDTAAAIAEISEGQHGIKIKLHDKKGALVDLGKHLGMFKDKDDSPPSVTINFVAGDEKL
jgi:phage terminase small subunit